MNYADAGGPGTPVGAGRDRSAVRRPILLLRATNSFLLDAAHAAEMVRRRSGTEFVGFDGTGHWIHREAPDAYAEAVRGFFDRATSRRPAG